MNRFIIKNCKQAALMTAALLLAIPPVMHAQNPNSNGKGNGKMSNMRSTTQAQRHAARIKQGPTQRQVNVRFAGVNPSTATYSVFSTKSKPGKTFGLTNLSTGAGPRAAGFNPLATMLPPLAPGRLATPDYFGVPNYANSPLPQLDATGAIIPGTGMRKFVDVLPSLPIAVPDTSTFAGEDYYEISLEEYNQIMHSDLASANGGLGTLLRGYRQTNGPSPQAKPAYLGPVILAQSNRPVRVKFTNNLPAGAGGDLFIPTDTTYMGAGNGPTGTPYTQNRGTLHLHGGNTPWISDGTPHQWTAPASETTNNAKGLSTSNVPDMWFDSTTHALIASCAKQLTCAVAGATNDPGPGSMTFYWTNQQSGRLMFYHDHAYGITRLNVYGGEAAGYLLVDPVEEDALAAATVPGTVGTTPDLAHLVPLVIQDKTFVPDNGVTGGQLAAQDPTWDITGYGGFGNLWFPHVYMTNQNPADISGANPFGRWDYGPWFWPPQNPATFVPQGQPYPCPTAANPNLVCPGTPNPSGVPEGFMDTPVVNGMAYPKMTVDGAAYRFHILNASNDRTLSLGFYVADNLSVAITAPGSGYDATPGATTVQFVGGDGSGAVAVPVVSTGSVNGVLLTAAGAGYTAAPAVTFSAPQLAGGVLATGTATIDANGTVTGVIITNGGSGYSAAPTVTLAAAPVGGTNATAAATITPAGSIAAIQITTPPTAPYTIAPTVAIAGAGTGATAIASVNTEVKMVPATPPTAISFLQPCTSNPAVGIWGLGLATVSALNTPTGLQSSCWPSTWPTDGRDGGVPDPTTAGPAIIQIGTEGGRLRAPAVIPSTPTGYEYFRRSITVLNIGDHGLLLGPAERADIIVDFSAFKGKTLIMYNDAPAPVPAFDPRIDYYTGDVDQTMSGGAPSTLPGYGPNTRTIMQINVTGAGPANNFSLASLQSQLPAIYNAHQPPAIVPETALGGASDNYIRIQDTSLNIWMGSPVGSLQLTSGGGGYIAAPAVNITPNNGVGSGATAAATLAPTSVGSLTLTAGGSGYLTTPAVVFNNTGTGGSGAAATATLAGRSVASVRVTRGGNRYTSAPTVTFSAPPAGGTTATGTATISRGAVTGVTITNAGSGYVTAPTVTFSGGGGVNAQATAVLAPATVASITLTAAGSGYISAPTISFSGGFGSGAAATATLVPTVVASFTVTNGGTGYTAAPIVTVAPPTTTGTTATAVALVKPTPLIPKAIQELFTLDYGRMNATLGVEMPFTNFLTQTTIPYGYIDPPTEIFKDGETQLWKITHNGVDTHFIHFHLFNVQVINRVGWDGVIKPPDANEIGWKDTVRMNPLEDIVVALRPMSQQLPWKLPNSVRPLDVTMPLGSSGQFTDVDPTNQPAVVTNDLTNFGWEYVWHCHILGHEENDMMRAMSLVIPPDPAINATAVAQGAGRNRSVLVTWTDNSVNESDFLVQRSTSPTGPWTTIADVPSTTGPGMGTAVSYTDNNIIRRVTYYYQVVAANIVGYDKTYAAPAAGYPISTATAAPTGPTAGVTP